MSQALRHEVRRSHGPCFAAGKLDMCLSANAYSLMDRRSPCVMLTVVREQRIAS